MQSPAVGNTPSETPDQFAVHIRKVAFMIETAAYVSVILLAAMAFLAVWKRQNLIRLLRVNALFSERMIVRNFSNMKQIFFHDELAVTG